MTRDQIIARIIGIEAGYVDNPRDPGGATKYGVTQRYLDEHRGRVPGLPASVADLTIAEATALYVADEWAEIQGDALPWPVAYLVMDTAVNSGAAEAVKLLQQALGLAVDGNLGPVTVAAANRGSVEDLCIEFAARRGVHYASLCATLAQFELGWMRRLIRSCITAVAP